MHKSYFSGTKRFLVAAGCLALTTFSCFKSEPEQLPVRNIAAAQAMKDANLASYIRELNHPDAKWRADAAKSIGRTKDFRGTVALIGALKDEDPEVRVAVLEALGELRDKTAVPAVIKAQEDKNPKVRGEASRALGEIRDVRAIPALVERLGDENEVVRRYTVAALKKFGVSAAPALIGALKDKTDKNKKVREGAAEILGTIGYEGATPFLIEALNDEEENVRAVAARALGERKDKAAITALVGRLRDKSEGKVAKAAAARALGEMQDRSAVPALIEALKDENETVRTNACTALGKIRDESAVPELIERLLKDRNAKVREEAARALGEIKDKSAVPALIEAIDVFPMDTDLVFKVSKALRNIGMPAVPALVEALKNNYYRNIDMMPTVRIMADALRNRSTAIEAVPANPALIKAMKDMYNRILVVKTLGDIASDDPNNYASIGTLAVPTLLKLLITGSNLEKIVVAKALGEIKDRSAIPALRIMAETDLNGECRESAKSALQKIEKTELP